MKLITLKFPFGRTERVSREAAEFALVIDRIGRHPALAKQLAPALAAVKQSADLIDHIERMSGTERLDEMISKLVTP